ncbi:MAG: 4Fe-4S binding protein [Anaerolineaceae bacterium]|nr:4Fe-4S binding protein [Anaerolineaceae bacterium]
MKGKGIIQGLGITLKHFVDTYLEDIKWRGKRYFNPEGIESRRSSDTRGIFTIQYPEEKLPVPEEFRYIPFLIYEIDSDGKKNYRCTACGICAKVCPPQCIWIVREINPKTNRPVPTPAEFHIDIDICMNCGLCAEFCPFDSIKMDHDYEIASYNRFSDHIYDLEKLSRPVSYYAELCPTNYAQQEAARAAKKAAQAAKTAKVAEK